jgi:aspartate/methionine/tyrosine aminotransferase
MRLAPFALERWQSTYEHHVDINLSESGVHPLRLEELVDTPEGRTALFAQDLCYTQTNGTAALREIIASLYPGATPDHVQVTNGGSEANYVTLWRLVEPGDDVVVMVPNYMQAPAIAACFGATVRRWTLTEDRAGGAWRADLDGLRALVTARTKAILVCNPNNPTGARLDGPTLDGICAIAARHGAWVVSDEIYRGAELDGVETPSLWGRYERTIVTSGLSKAYGLPGLRIGWAAAPPGLISDLWSYHDYTTIGPGALSDRLARVALEPSRRRQLLDRTRRILTTNYPVLRDWIGRQAGAFGHAAPKAGAIAFVHYAHPLNSTDLVSRLRTEKSVLMVPGDHFELDGYLRVGFGGDRRALSAGLERLQDLLADCTASTRRLG